MPLLDPQEAPQTGLTRCEGCPHGYGKLVGNRGRIDSPLVVVGESPGVQEIRNNLPFFGPSGTILEAGLAQHGDVTPYITNAIICFPGTSKQKDTTKMVTACHTCNPRLRADILQHPRKVILAMGTPAIQALTGNYNLKITQVRGQVFQSDLAEKGIVAAVHPAFLMRGGGSLRQWMQDVDYAISLCKGNDYRKYVIPEFKVASSVDDVRALAAKFKSLPEDTPIAADSETGGYDGFDHLRDRILSTGYCFDPTLVYVIPEGLTRESNCLFDNHCRFIWHNGKFDAKFYRAGDVREVRVDEDTMLLSYALDETAGIHDLETVGSDIIGVPDWKFMIKPYLEQAKIDKNFSPKLTPNKKGELVRQTVTYDCIPRPILHDYMSRDISTTLQVFPVLRRQTSKDPKLELLYTRMLMPMVPYLVRTEENGLRIDPEMVKKNKERLEADIAVHRKTLDDIAAQHEMTGCNWNSPQQVAVMLYDKLKLPHKATDRSTDVKTLDDLPQVPFVVALKKLRKVAKAESTYVRPALGWVNKDGRVHTTYKIHGTATGRLASEDPNILNIPRDPLLRGMFIADGWFLEVDVSQAELRVLAELSGDKELTHIYTTAGMSIHDVVTVETFGDHSTYTPEQLAFQINKFNVHNFPDKLYDEQKMKAKNINFGIPYGITAFGLAEQMDCSPKEANQYLDKWYNKFEGATQFLRLCHEAPVKNKTLVTWFGRKKRFGVVSPERLQGMQNEAKNFFMQSIASDIVMDTGINMEQRAETLGCKIVNTVYDSILFECPPNREVVETLANETIAMLADKAKYWGMKKIPLIGEAKVGQRWGSLKDIKKFDWSTPQELAA